MARHARWTARGLRIAADDRAPARPRQAPAHWRHSRIARVGLRAGAILAAAALLCCGGGNDTPEARVRALLTETETAAEARDVGRLTEAVSERYADAAGRDRQAVKGLLAYTFMRHRSIHLLTRHHEVTIAEPGRAQAVVFVAMAGTPIAAVEDLAGLHADLYRFAFALEEEDGAWRVIRADWRPARAEDFL
jgi:hypothetical protein